MSNNKGPQPIKPSGSIEFELTDVATARAAVAKPALVDAIEKLLPGQWDELRRAATAADRALTGPAIEWVLALPAHARPKALCEQFPRIANHLAEHWDRLPDIQLALMRLLADERGQRRGFSLQIEQEIGRLSVHVQSLLEGQPTEPAGL